MAVGCIPQLRDESVTEAGDAFCSGGNTEQVKSRFRFRCQHCFSLASCRMLNLRIWFSSVQWELQYQCWSHRICVCVCARLVAQSCPTLCNPMGYSLPGSSGCGILQARILEWVAIAFSRGSSQPRDRTQVSWHCRRILYQLSHSQDRREHSSFLKGLT